MLFEGESLSYSIRGDSPGEVFLKIIIKDPSQVRNTIEYHPVNVLESVIPPPGLTFMQPHKWPDIYVRIHSFHIGVSMVIDVVFDAPVVGIPTKYIEKVGRYLVDPKVP